MMRKVPLWALAAVALGLRLWGITFGLPAIYRPDENIVVGRAMGVLTGTFDPQFANWPHLYFYVSAASLELLRPAFSLLGPAAPYLGLRLLAALLGTATVVLVYVVGRRAYGQTAGLIGALGLAVAFLHVRDSHFATLDIPLTLACIATLYFAVRLAQSGALRPALLAGVCAGLAAGVKYNGALTLAGIAASVLTRFGGDSARRFIPLAARLVGIGLLSLLVFALTSPFLMIDFPLFRHSLGYIFAHLAAATLPEVGWVQLVRLSLWNGLDPPLFCLSLAGVMYAMQRRTPADWILLSFLLAFYGLMGFGHTVFVRYADPLLPVLVTLGGRALAEFTRVFVRQHLVLVIGLGVVLLPPLTHDVTFDSLITKTDTRSLAFDWLEANVPAGARIADLYDAGPAHDQTIIASGRHSLGAQDPYVATFLQNRFEDRYTVHDLTLAELDSNSIDTLKADGVSYVVYSLPQPDAGCAPPSPLGRALRSTARLLRMFMPTKGCSDSVFDPIDGYFVPLAGYDGWLRPGPVIRIYRLG
jgi:4-amino-4-deoxy-L-arabinose transferase-like glycosyltransferase